MVHLPRGHRLERSRFLVVMALAVPLWITSCKDGDDDDDGGAHGAGAGMTAAGTGGTGGGTSGAGATGDAGSQSSSAGSGKGGASSGAGRPSTAGTSSAAGGGSGGGNGGNAGVSTGGGGAGNGGMTSAGTGNGGTAGSDAGMGSDAGTSSRAGTGGSSGTGGGSSIGGRGPMPGFECGETTCTTGQTCVSCAVGVTPTYELRCTPDEEDDPDGHAQAIKDCQMASNWGQCDGPEDCPPGEHCVYTMESRGRSVCDAEPVVGPGVNCCFSCDSFATCTLCWSEADCPETYICVRSAGQPPDGPGGCRLAE